MTANQPPTQNGLTTRQILITAYLVIAMGFTVYESLFGAENYRGFFYNFGKSLVWPFLVFPILGKIVGSILLLVIIGAVIVSPYLSDERDK